MGYIAIHITAVSDFRDSYIKVIQIIQCQKFT